MLSRGTKYYKGFVLQTTLRYLESEISMPISLARLTPVACFYAVGRFPAQSIRSYGTVTRMKEYIDGDLKRVFALQDMIVSMTRRGCRDRDSSPNAILVSVLIACSLTLLRPV